MQVRPITLGPPTSDDLDHLNNLILRSKAVWGYDEDFMAACADELRIDEGLLKQNFFVTATENGQVIGVAEIMIEGKSAHLEKLFVDPDCMRSGAGKLLFGWAQETARAAGADQLVIESDPDAEGFYQAMGAVRTGLTPSGSIPGRMLPELTLNLS